MPGATTGVHDRNIIRRVRPTGESAGRVARKYMIRLEKADLVNQEMKLRLAAAAKMEPDEFERQFEAERGWYYLC